MDRGGRGPSRSDITGLISVAVPQGKRSVRWWLVRYNNAMSWIADVMISVDDADRANVAALSEWLRVAAPHRDEPSRVGVGYLRPITDRDSQWGGWKRPGCEVWAGVLNHADLRALRQRVSGIPWEEPNAVQLFTMDEDEKPSAYRSAGLSGRTGVLFG